MRAATSHLVELLLAPPEGPDLIADQIEDPHRSLVLVEDAPRVRERPVAFDALPEVDVKLQPVEGGR